MQYYVCLIMPYYAYYGEEKKMSLLNAWMILRMITDRKSRDFLIKIHTTLRDDPNYSLSNMLKATKSMIKNNKIIYFNNQYFMFYNIPPIPSQAFLNYLTATREEKNLFTQQMLVRKSAPLSFSLSLTDRCPYNCIYCSAKGRKMGRELSTEEWLKVADELKEMKIPIIFFTGGEPLLREDLEQIIKAFGQDTLTYLFTTGQNLSLERAISLKKNGLLGIAISLDSTDPDQNDKIQGKKGAFVNAVQAIRKAKAAGLYTIISTVLLKSELSKKELMKFFRLGKEYQADELLMIEPVLSGNLLVNEERQSFLYTEETKQELIKLQIKINRKWSGPKITISPLVEGKEMFGCAAGTQHSYISASGELFPCDFVPLSFGNVKNNKVRGLWLEMNETIGIPKGDCLAKEIFQKLKGKSDQELPLGKKDSIKICLECKTKEYPRFYQILQGKAD